VSSGSSPTDVGNGDDPFLALEDVSLRYGQAAALDDVTLRVQRGERVAILGPSGAGKSSLLGVANTSRRPTTGAVRLFGHDPMSLGPSERRALRRRIGTVDQRPPLPGPLRVVHNVNAGRLGQWPTWRALWSLLRAHDVDGASDALDRLGIGDKVWRRTDELSGGERQRVALARVMVQGAELVLADEPVSGLDPARARDVLGLLCGCPGDAVDDRVPGPRFETVVVALHDVELAREHVDRVVGLRGGRVLFDVPVDALTPDLTDRLYDLTTTPA